MAYFAQLKSLYQEVGIPQPIVYPRASATIIEEKVERVFDRFSLNLLDFFRDVEIVKERVAARISDISIDELFGGTLSTLQETLDRMKPSLESIDPTLIGALENVSRKTLSGVEGLKEKVVAAQLRQHEVSLRQIDKSSNHVFPSGNFQERELNVLFFLNKYGLEFVRWLSGELAIDIFKHQIIRL
ncbi:MAG TPA: hypothetical protein DCP63_08505 [Bacteroidetes bacterium]|nr:hypothetical protein [Bacteroidota bacterium]